MLLRYICKRLITIAFSIVIITTITYCLMYAAPGNFFDITRFQNMSNTQSSMNQENIEMLRRGFEKKYGLDQPLWKQILLYLQGAVRFKFGPAFSNPTSNIEDLIYEKFPVTLSLGLSAIVLAVLLGIPLGVLAALKRNTWLDY
ncbi:MAG TPA: ABC transporter permease, partial [Bacillota bacterium]|nr:ABC transporter permease [Bacillota bacterium]